MLVVILNYGYLQGKCNLYLICCIIKIIELLKYHNYAVIIKLRFSDEDITNCIVFATGMLLPIMINSSINISV